MATDLLFLYLSILWLITSTFTATIATSSEEVPSIDGDFGYGCIDTFHGNVAPHLNDIYKFYVCNGRGGAASEHTCPTGAVFDPWYMQCRDALIVGLQPTHIDPDAIKVETYDHLCEGAETNTVLAHPDICSAYIECLIGGQADIVECPADKYYSLDMQACDWPENVECVTTPKIW